MHFLGFYPHWKEVAKHLTLLHTLEDHLWSVFHLLHVEAREHEFFSCFSPIIAKIRL